MLKDVLCGLKEAHFHVDLEDKVVDGVEYRDASPSVEVPMSGLDSEEALEFVEDDLDIVCVDTVG